MTLKPLLTEELLRAFTILNRELFGGELKTPAIVIDCTKKFCIRYASECLIIGSKFGATEYHDLLLAMLHELVHMRNEQRGVADVTANQYHNGKFLSAALAVGLVVKKHKSQGWAITGVNIPKGGLDPQVCRVPTHAAVKRRIQTFRDVAMKDEVLLEAQSDVAKQVARRPPTKPCFLKYVCQCPPPHNSVRSGRRPNGVNPLKITCDVCHAGFVCVTGK